MTEAKIIIILGTLLIAWACLPWRSTVERRLQRRRDLRRIKRWRRDRLRFARPNRRWR